MTTFFPAVSFADTVPSDAVTCTPPSVLTPGVHVPTGAEAGMFHYDCDLSLWVSDHYIYDPSTTYTSPLDPQVYTYNNDTGLWDVDIWSFSPAQSAYVLRTYSVGTPPAGATTVGSPPPPVIASATLASPTTDPSGVTGSNSLDGTINNTTGQTLNNTIGSVSDSGNALVFGNTLAGSALSGNALALATVVNMLQSSGNTFGIGGNAVTFVSNINGDVNGDLLLDPALISTIQPATSSLDNNLTLNTSNTVGQAINNDINLAANSGNATVDSNTTAGNATTGSATAIANVLNFLNSAVSSGKSFLGVVNINGNLNGDILLPPGFIDQLLSSNVPTVDINTDLNLNNTTNQAINNGVTATAASGDATVSENTTAGNATTGSATSHITAFNLTGSNVVGANDLLVFVNVLGTWYGMIFNAPGATTAQLGSGITQNSFNANADVNMDNNTNQTINNAINVSAKTGNATVSENTNAGNATSGDARAAVNLLNVTNSNLSLANWFGILFINVFGTWNGSFGVNTSAGDPVTTPDTTGGRGGDGSTPSTPATPQLFKFVARSVGSATTGASSTGSGSDTSSDSQGVVLAAQTQHNTPRTTATLPTTEGAHTNFWLPAGGIALGLGMLLFERIRSFRSRSLN
ncbi:MAG: hypothetical protein ABIO22_01305 [Candidatus Saccharimonadales bacterium]